jgi:UDP-glucuronate 4-epimerase
MRVMKTFPAPDPHWSGQAPDPGTSYAPYRLYNIGNNQPVTLTRFIEVLEKNLGMTAEKELLDMQPGDVPATCADIDDLYNAVGFRPVTTIETGIQRFVEWYRSYYKIRD